MEISEPPVCQKTTEKPERNQEVWVCKESGQEMRLENNQWICDQCAGSNTRAGKQREVDKPLSLSGSEIAEGMLKAREYFKKQKQEDEANKTEQKEQKEQERKNNRQRGG